MKLADVPATAPSHSGSAGIPARVRRESRRGSEGPRLPRTRLRPSGVGGLRAGRAGWATSCQVASSIAAILFLYVGVENAVGGWLVSLADEFQPDARGDGLSGSDRASGRPFSPAARSPPLVAAPSVRDPRSTLPGIILAAGGLLGLVTSLTRGPVRDRGRGDLGRRRGGRSRYAVPADRRLSRRSHGRRLGSRSDGLGVRARGYRRRRPARGSPARLAGGADGLAAGFVAPVAGLAPARPALRLAAPDPCGATTTTGFTTCSDPRK